MTEIDRIKRKFRILDYAGRVFLALVVAAQVWFAIDWWMEIRARRIKDQTVATPSSRQSPSAGPS